MEVLWPVLPVVYSDKTARVLENLNYNGAVVDLRNEASWGNAQGWENHAPLSDAVRQDAQGHFKKLDDILENPV